MAPDSWVIHISAEESWNRWGGKELDLLTTIISSREARLAFVADDVWFDGYTITNFEVRYARMNC